jgi:cardiolipin synthase A/B
MHAKTAVADGCWARVGSSNLNVASWIGNYELDVVVEDEQFAQAMERMYLRDLGHATELVLPAPRRRPETPLAVSGESARRAGKVLRGSGSASRAAAGALRLGHTVKAALGNQRLLRPAEAWIVAMLGIMLLVAAAAAVQWPLVAALPAAGVAAWIGIAFLGRAADLRRERRRRISSNKSGDPH